MSNILAPSILEECILQARSKVKRALEETKPGSTLRCPNFHIFLYKGIRCELLQCLSCNTAWVGYVVVPADSFVLNWPESEGRPFTCGIDFDICTERNERLIGLHTMHVIDGLYEPKCRERSVDFVVALLRSFIDVLEYEQQHAGDKTGEARAEVRHCSYRADS